MILAGDLGGTKSNLGLFDVKDGKLTQVAFKRYASREHGGLEEIAHDFLNGHAAQVSAASFGIAGPVVNNRVQATNIPWIVDGAKVAQEFHLKHVRLLNDLEATAYGIEVLDGTQLETLHPGVPVPNANSVVLSAGTGLGEGVMFWDGTRHLPMSTEAGHTDFAPNTDQQADLWKFLRKKFEFVSTEKILSGGGFQRVHEFLDPSVRHPGFDDHSVDPAPGITQRGLDGSCKVCAATLNLWVEIYGSEAGNLALRSVARGGIYVAGGIALKMMPKMRDGRFVESVHRKEKLGDFLRQIPTHVVLNDECPLIGAAYVAWKNI
jgi:glucokinase